jgi:hypothetical protein
VHVLACVELDPHALRHLPALRARYLDALARAGRFDKLAANVGAETSLATWLLARSGRPFRALAMRRLARADDAHSLAGQALALFTAGRPDLAVRTLALPAPARGPAELLRAWGDLGTLVALAAPVPGGDPDIIDFPALAALERALAADLTGASVYLAGTFTDRAALLAAIERRGALVVSGPFGKVDYVLVGDPVDPEELARLTSLGATPLSPAHLEL